MIGAPLWSWTSPVWLVVALAAVGYGSVARGANRREWGMFLCGMAMLAAAFVSPVGVLADGYLFSAHMVQHLILLLVVPACVVLALPKDAAAEWFKRPSLDRIGRWLSTPSLGWILGVGAMWFWHVPALCSAATQQTGLGIARDASLLFAGLAFWWPVFAPVERYRLHPLSGIAYLFSACLGCTLLGIYITFSPVSVCPVFANPVDRIGILNGLYNAGLTPGVDQHLGGLMMWVPPCILYVAAIINLLCRWYSTTDEPSRAYSPLTH
jgi:cytochrome c oxidase assembly factor CtaG